MKLNTPSERFFVFMAIVMLFGVGYQHYHFYQSDKNINEAIEEHNERVGRYVVILTELQSEISRLERLERFHKNELRRTKSQLYIMENICMSLLPMMVSTNDYGELIWIKR